MFGGSKAEAMTMRGKLLKYLIASTVMPLVVIVLLSIVMIRFIIDNRIQENIHTNLAYVSSDLEASLQNLIYTSERFAFLCINNDDFEAYLTSNNYYEKSLLHKNINLNVNLMLTSNPEIGLVFFYLPEEDVILFNNFYSNTSTVKQFIPQLQAIHQEGPISFHKPHPSFHANSTAEVFSVMYDLTLDTADNQIQVGIYLETGTNFIRQTFHEKSGEEGVYSLIWHDNVVLSNEIENVKYVRFYSDHSPLGFQVCYAIPAGRYNMELVIWIITGLFVITVSIFASVMIAIYIWRSINDPLRVIRKNIQTIASGNESAYISVLGIKEFDEVITHINEMQDRLADLIMGIKNERDEKSRLEIQILLSQINPHFLYNTLNTIQWLARLANQKEIDYFVQSFVNLLQYNLGKEGFIVKVEEELNALKDYIYIQQVRYDHHLQVDISAEEQALQEEIPRFILQPIVENAIYHGFVDGNGTIVITAKKKENVLQISIKDNGRGMNRETLRTVLDKPHSPQAGEGMGMGIGFKYVYRALDKTFGDRYSITVNSRINEGTEVLIEVKCYEQDQDQDQSAYCGR